MKRTTRPTTTKLILPNCKQIPARLVPWQEIHVGPVSGCSTTVVPDSSKERLAVLLAGPILRRAGQCAVDIWVATSVRVNVTARVLNPKGAFCQPLETWEQLGEATAQPELLGANLFTTTVRVMRPGRKHFPRGVVLAYDLIFHAPPKYYFTNEGGLIERKELAYGNSPLPTFTLGLCEHKRRSNFVHGSCRKLHDDDDDDAMEKLDTHMEDTWNIVDDRPSALLLTGDQIYADEVDDNIAKGIAVASKKLLGWEEQVPEEGKELIPDNWKMPTQHGKTLSDQVTEQRRPHKTVQIPGERSLPKLGGKNNSRESLLKAVGFTSDNADNHLMAFGEFAAMYLLAWSPALWRYNEVEKEVEKHELMKSRLKSIIAVRRILANVPSYMIMDDHEVSDDWPMTLTQHNTVKHSPIGRWIAANGLAACWVFQLKDNSRDAPFRRNLFAYLKNGLALKCIGRPPGSKAERNALNEFGHMRDRAYCVSVLNSRNFGFITPTIPPVMFLDTRTQRGLQENGLPALLDDDALSDFRKNLQKLPRDSSMPVLVVSPTPVIGFAAYEDTVRDFFRLAKAGAPDPAVTDKHNDDQTHGKDKVKYKRDPEMWSHNSRSFYGLFTQMEESRRKQFVIFSGDVHYGFVGQTDFVREGISKLSVVQLTSSALRKRPGLKDRLFMRIGTFINGRTLDPERHSFYLSPKGDILFPRPFHSHAEPVASLETKFHITDGQHLAFKHNNFGRVIIDWSQDELKVTQTLIGHKSGKTVIVTLPGVPE